MKRVNLLLVLLALVSVASASSIDFDLVGSPVQNSASDIYSIDLVANFYGDWTGSGQVALEFNESYTDLISVNLVNANSYSTTILFPGIIDVSVNNQSFSDEARVVLATIDLQTTTNGTYFYVRDNSDTGWFKSYKNTDFDGASLVDNPVFNGHGTPNLDAIKIVDAGNVVPEPATMALLGLGGLLIRRKK